MGNVSPSSDSSMGLQSEERVAMFQIPQWAYNQRNVSPSSKFLDGAYNMRNVVISDTLVMLFNTTHNHLTCDLGGSEGIQTQLSHAKGVEEGLVWKVQGNTHWRDGSVGKLSNGNQLSYHCRLWTYDLDMMRLCGGSQQRNML